MHGTAAGAGQGMDAGRRVGGLPVGVELVHAAAHESRVRSAAGLVQLSSGIGAYLMGEERVSQDRRLSSGIGARLPGF